jgi:cysteinyl-tRNA synthetase
VLQLFDTASGRVTPLRLRTPGQVSMYVCGPTVYGPPHLGHGRFALVFDVLRRYLSWQGLEVSYVSNITDIDDKIIDKAAADGSTAAEVADHYEQVWWDAMDRIGVQRPTHDPHATAWVEGMVALIADLVGRGSAYVLDDGVYFDSGTVADYGLLARQSLDSLRAGARVDVDDAKRAPTDFALWKLAKPGEPSWPSPWGEGRPGWHTECVVMSLGLLGDGFDLHGGGADLAFPHHENERAQAVACGREFAGHWMHNGFVEVAGEKMSKSLGNFTDLQTLCDAHDPRAYRLLVLRSHYRSPLEVSDASAGDASRALERLDAFARRVAPLLDAAPVVPDPDIMATFVGRMDDDLDTPAVVDLMFTTVRKANGLLDAGDDVGAAGLAAAVMEIAGAVGLVLGVGDDGGPPPEMVALARQRDEARARRDFAAADGLRDQIQAAGWIVEDTADGTALRRS